MIPFRAEVGGKEGTELHAFVGTDFYIQARPGATGWSAR